MLFRSSQSIKRLNRLRRGTVIFLLTFAFFDMAVVDIFFPQLCEDRRTSSFLTNQVGSTNKPTEKGAAEKLIGKGAAEFAPIRDHGSQPGQDSHESPIDEDCFCCCSHVIPSQHVNVAAINSPPQPDDPAITSLPLPPPHGAFHPPRIS